MKKYQHSLSNMFLRRSSSRALAPSPDRPIAIIGGGVHGLSIAYHLSKTLVPGSVVVFEQDTKYTRASTPRAVGGIRQQFSTRSCTELSKWSYDFYANASQHLGTTEQPSVDISFVNSSYLYMFDASEDSNMRARYELQRGNGCDITLLNPRELYSKFPWLNVSGLAGAIHGNSREGFIDPQSALDAFKRAVIAAKVSFFPLSVVGLGVEGSDGAATPNDGVCPHGLAATRRTTSVTVRLPDGSESDIPVSGVINASGSWARDVFAMAGAGPALPFRHSTFGPPPAHSRGGPLEGWTGTDAPYDPKEVRRPGDADAAAARDPRLAVALPVEPRNRINYVFAAPNGPGLKGPHGSIPLTILPGGHFFRKEGAAGTTYVAGAAPDPAADAGTGSLKHEFETFENVLWHALAEYIPAFQSIKLRSAWAGFYEMSTFDSNAFIGRHPSFENLYVSAGYSGHGLQHAPAAGHVMADLVLGREPIIDTAELSLRRLFANKPIEELCVIG